jgi:hypothetical protein
MRRRDTETQRNKKGNLCASASLSLTVPGLLCALNNLCGLYSVLSASIGSSALARRAGT